jgi:L-asparagine transporter-like permease
MKWQFGLLMTMTIICFLVFIFFIVFCLRQPRNAVRDDKKLTLLMILAWIFFVLLFTLFIIAIIWDGMMEVQGRRARCQLAVVTGYIINGYVNKYNNS